MKDNHFEFQSTFKNTWQNLACMVLITDKNGDIIFTNKMFTTTSKFTPDDVIGKNYKTLFLNSLPENISQRIIDSLLKGKMWQGILTNKKKDNSIYYAKTTIAPIKNQKTTIQHFIIFMQEISEEEFLIESSQKILTHHLPSGIIIINNKNNIIYLNKYALKILKARRKDLINKQFDRLIQIAKGDRRVDLKEKIADKNRATIKEAIIIHGDSIIFSNLSIFKITHFEHQIGTILVMNNIASKKDRKEKTKMLTEIEKLRVFLMGFGHDFNNLLAITQLQLQSAEMFLEKDISKAKEKLKRVSEKLNEISKLISSFFESATSRPIPVKTDINALIKSIIGKLSEQFKEITFNLKEKGRFIILVDREKIKYTIEQILLNAIESQDYKGKVEITIEKANILETIALHLPEKEYLKISIKDYGKGIKKEHLPLLFTPYFTTKERTYEKQRGLSLAICNFNVQKHGGHIKVITEEGKGSEFIIFLPLSHKKQVNY